MEKQYSVKTLALLWDVPEKTIRNWMDCGMLRRTRLCGRVVIAESEACRFMRDSNAQQDAAEVVCA